MHIAYIVLAVVTALWVGFSAFSLLTQKPFVVEPLVQYGVPRSWWAKLGFLKAAGALGMVVGIALPPIGIAAAIGIILYFLGAVVTIVRAGAWGHVAFPVLYLAPAAVALVLQLNS
ncbi:DoxX family protein [Nocardia stercoris]|uniref:DoxX family protein n=1 Tax=Nocardia stercoris TaxID=2483361 RepID=A0A3M2KW42_9NOCA|nr:DoxX family protein [Nocardia stercoris]RMI29689.1 DoxX family protein [Nocardia stercoris]